MKLRVASGLDAGAPDARSRPVIVEAPASCHGCRGCGLRSSTREINLSPPRELPGPVDIEVTARSQLFLLGNSLLLPLAGFVAGAAIGSSLSAGDIGSVAMAVAGLGLGMVLCRAGGEERITWIEVDE